MRTLRVKEREILISFKEKPPGEIISPIGDRYVAHDVDNISPVSDAYGRRARERAGYVRGRRPLGTKTHNKAKRERMFRLIAEFKRQWNSVITRINP